MAIVKPCAVQCTCGHSFEVNLSNGVNAARSPEVREQIKAGTFHRVTCPSCGTQVTAEKSFLYTDLGRGTVILVKPRQDRHLWRQASTSLDLTAELIPESLSAKDRRKLRVVFGMQELREKIIAEDLTIDDGILELLKVVAVHDHPFLLQRPRLRLTLEGRSKGQLELKATFDHNNRSFKLGIDADRFARFARQKAKLQNWVRKAGHTESVLEGDGGKWVNMWRWSPQPGALDLLRTYALEIRSGRPVDTAEPTFARMLQGLPRGAQLPQWAKNDLQTVFDYARRNRDSVLQDKLFEIRFGKPLEDDWSANQNETDIDTLWNLLRNLPENDVEGNTSIAEIFLDLGSGGGSYDPRSGDIYIGESELSDAQRFANVVRHEIGHGVHEKNERVIDEWLKTRFGWQMFSPNQSGVNSWVALMGGWDRFGVSAAERSEIPLLLKSALGRGGSWSPGPRPTTPTGHAWARPGFGPRLAYEQTGANWYVHNRQWYRANGKAFFLNFWYGTLCTVDEATLDLVGKMPDSYASMSHFEFFAELYALFHDRDDPLRDNIPADVLDWLQNQSGGPQFAPARPAERESWKDTIRPD